MSFCFFFFFNDTATTEIYTLSDTLSLHDALPISGSASAGRCSWWRCPWAPGRSEEHTSELQSPLNISYAVFCLKKKKQKINKKANTLKEPKKITKTENNYK